MAMHVDRAGKIPHGPDNLHLPLARNAVVAEGKMHIAQAILLGQIDLRLRAIHAQNRLDSQVRKGLECFIRVGNASAVEGRRELMRVVQIRQGNNRPGGVGGRARRRRPHSIAIAPFTWVVGDGRDGIGCWFAIAIPRCTLTGHRYCEESKDHERKRERRKPHVRNSNTRDTELKLPDSDYRNSMKLCHNRK